MADRLALGRSIRDMLAMACFLPDPGKQPGAGSIKEWLQIADEHYPPASVKAMLALADELEDITSNKPFRPLEVIAKDIETIAQQFTGDADLLQSELCRRKGYQIMDL